MEQREVFSHRPGRTPLLNRNTPIKNNYLHKENLLHEKVAKVPWAHIFELGTFKGGSVKKHPVVSSKYSFVLLYWFY